MRGIISHISLPRAPQALSSCKWSQELLQWASLKCRLLGGSSGDFPEVWKMHFSALQAITRDKCTHLLLPSPSKLQRETTSHSAFDLIIARTGLGLGVKMSSNTWDQKHTWNTFTLSVFNLNKMPKWGNNKIPSFLKFRGSVIFPPTPNHIFMSFMFLCKSILCREKSLSRAVQQKFFFLTAVPSHETSQAATFQKIPSKTFFEAPWDKNNSTSTHCVSTVLQISRGSLN